MDARNDPLTDAIVRFIGLLIGTGPGPQSNAAEQCRADLAAHEKAGMRISQKYEGVSATAIELRAKSEGITFSSHVPTAFRAAILDHLADQNAPTDVNSSHLTWCRYASVKPGQWPHPVTRINRAEVAPAMLDDPRTAIIGRAQPHRAGLHR